MSLRSQSAVLFTKSTHERRYVFRYVRLFFVLEYAKFFCSKNTNFLFENIKRNNRRIQRLAKYYKYYWIFCFLFMYHPFLMHDEYYRIH